jgi:site-specific DNA recombinase
MIVNVAAGRRTDEVLLDVEDVAMGHTNVMRWNAPARWVRPKALAHPPLLDEDTFTRVQEMLSRRGTKGSQHLQHPTRHPYIFRGAVQCGRV